MPECPRDPHEFAASRPLSELKAALSGAQNQLQEGHVKENPQSSGSPWPRGLSDIFWQTLNHQSRHNITDFGMVASGISELCVNSEAAPTSVHAAVPPQQELLPESAPDSEQYGDGLGRGETVTDPVAEEGAASVPAPALPPVYLHSTGNIQQCKNSLHGAGQVSLPGWSLESGFIVYVPYIIEARWFC